VLVDDDALEDTDAVLLATTVLDAEETTPCAELVAATGTTLAVLRTTTSLALEEAKVAGATEVTTAATLLAEVWTADTNALLEASTGDETATLLKLSAVGALLAMTILLGDAAAEVVGTPALLECAERVKV
jgi:hypothetical protein